MSIFPAQNYCFTPKSITKSSIIFRIPIYQRLFVWEEKQITLFLNDLYNNSIEHASSYYYIGIVTSVRSSSIKDYEYFDVVDGQQRLTMIMLLAICFSEKNLELEEFWNSYISAEPDQKFRIENYADTNFNLESFREKLKPCLEIVNNWLGLKDDNDIKKYSKYVFEKLSFFISCLPSEYESYEINQYFETMNSSGKNLEQHDIVKIDILNKLDGTDKKEAVLKKWNRVSNFSILYESKGDKSDSDYKKYLQKVIKDGCGEIKFEKKDDTSSFQNPSQIIRNIVPKQKTRNRRIKNTSGYDSVLSFPEFLLQVLYHFLGKNEQKRSEKLENLGFSKEFFFNPCHLKNTFDKILLCQETKSIEEYIACLIYYRNVLDSCFIRIAKESTFNKYVLEDFPFDDFCSSSLSQDNWSDVLMMYESMLYVNYSSYSTYYFWFNDLMDYIDECVEFKQEITSSSLFKALFDKDRKRNNINTLSQDSMKYPIIDRYWFWYLDFVLWFIRKELFKDLQLELADNYIFRSNRSIEHVSPQTPKDNATINLKEANPELNSFGNLCMISSGLNSSLRNQVYSMKRAYVMALLKKEIEPHIESLKLLVIYKEYEEFLEKKGKSFDSEKNQTELYKEFIAKHGQNMYEKIKNSVDLFK